MTGRRTRRTATGGSGAPAPGWSAAGIAIRAVRRGDLAQIIAIDAAVTGIEKRSYWYVVFRRYGVAAEAGRQFLVAEAGGRVVGLRHRRSPRLGIRLAALRLGVRRSTCEPDARQHGHRRATARGDLRTASAAQA